MNVTALKKIRVAVSLLFFLFTISLFLDYRNILPPSVYSKVLFLQFIPSFVKFISIAGLGAIGFIVILLLTLFSGRVYCSSICPLGTLQDVISFLSRILKKKKGKKKREFLRYEKSKNWWRYSFLALAVIPFLGGTILFINLLDPYSSFGKISAHLFRPLLIMVNNSIAFLFEKMNLYIVYPFEYKGVETFSLLFAFAIFMLVVYLSLTKGRLYCNTICPVGTLLGLVSKYSFVKIAVDEKSCKSCGICERVCKSNCIDTKKKTVDFDRCVACFNCFDVCPTDGMKFEYGFLSPSKKNQQNIEETQVSKREEQVSHSKRNFLFNTFVYAVGLTGITLSQVKITPKKESKVAVFRKNPVTPPGSQSRNNFAQNCTACHLCVSVCPTQVLQPAYLEYGLLGMFQPRMDFQIGFCNFECKLCGDVCPTNAISPIPLKEKKLKQLGKAKFVKDNCIVNTENTDCGACSEHCPTKAVNMVPYKNKLVIPEVKDEFCIGCGACEFACPTKPYKAIYVEGNPKHLTAKINKEKKIEQKVDYKEEFPF
ncbi:MAG: 4Fe-4S binding protein [Ignavibacteriaceae bacterium]|jgi:ferredoxin